LIRLFCGKVHFRNIRLFSSDLNKVAVVSSIWLQEGVQYRGLGDASEYENIRTAEPSLVDGYIWLMQGVGEVKEAGS
jgi:hypothetical protein